MQPRRRAGPLLFCAAVGLALVGGCGPGLGAGSKWAEQPLVEDEKPVGALPPGANENLPPPSSGRTTHTLGQPRSREPGGVAPGGGRVLGTFRNTYYDFPREADHKGDAVALMNASCQPIAQVPRGFHDAVCVQGSGVLKRGGVVSFAKRDCACAEICPRTSQKICFDALDPKQFPFGRGAAGTAIHPFRTIAADTDVLPMGTVVYIPELDGVPRGGGSGEPLDGCFVVEDRGLRVKGEHVDIFTGHPQHTAALEQIVPSNHGVTVVVQAPKCAPRASPLPR
ncbi:MAG: hypothetical protein JST00_00190 [Deltaproteobacteria bacterium]|nr:hypothetical protein [Deltaproteobacteria bacterium]